MNPQEYTDMSQDTLLHQVRTLGLLVILDSP